MKLPRPKSRLRTSPCCRSPMWCSMSSQAAGGVNVLTQSEAYAKGDVASGLPQSSTLSVCDVCSWHETTCRPRCATSPFRAKRKHMLASSFPVLPNADIWSERICQHPGPEPVLPLLIALISRKSVAFSVLIRQTWISGKRRGKPVSLCIHVARR